MKNIPVPKGFKFSGLHSGIKGKNKDLALILSKTPATCSGVFTKNKCRAYCVEHTEGKVRKTHSLQAMVINSGNANCFTGEKGRKDTIIIAEEIAKHLGIPQELVGVASTGKIGELLPIENIIKAIPTLVENLSSEGINDTAEAILTTDTTTKTYSVSIQIEDTPVVLTGIAKGAGMIAPDMATMLCFLVTDLYIESSVLDKILENCVETSFNSITVDGCTSTNDMVIAMANGSAGNSRIGSNSKYLPKIREAFNEITQSLAKMIVRDGEGATKLVEITVCGAGSSTEAKTVGMTVANSMLLKCALYGNTPNWGRIISAIGQTNLSIDPRCIDINIGPYTVLKNSEPMDFDKDTLRGYLSESEVHILINLKAGTEKWTVWTCDLTHKYIEMNKD